MISHSDVAKFARRFIDGDYALCNTDEGYDCLSMILTFYRAAGVVFPEEFKGFTETNYGARWLAGEGMEEYREFLEIIGGKIDMNYAIAGDLLVMDLGEEAPVCAGIYLGNGHALICFDKGIRVVPFRFFRSRLIEVRRCHKQ